MARDFFDTLALFSKVGVNAPVSLALGICCNFQGCKQLMGLQEPPPPALHLDLWSKSRLWS